MSQFPNNPYAPQGYPQQGAPQPAPQGYPQQGYPQQGAPQGYPQAPQGYPQQGAPHGYHQAPQGYGFAPPPSNQDVFDQIGAAQVPGARYPSLPAGNHVMEVVKIEKRRTRTSGEMVAAEMRVVQSSSPDVRPNAIFSETFFICDPKPDNAVMNQGRLKGLICTMAGLDPQNPDFGPYTTALRAAANPASQSMRGRLVAVYGTPATSKGGKQYVRSSYAAVQQTEQEVAARRAAQDANPIGEPSAPQAAAPQNYAPPAPYQAPQQNYAQPAPYQAPQAAPYQAPPAATAYQAPPQNYAPQAPQGYAPQPVTTPPTAYQPPPGFGTPQPFVTPPQFAAPQVQPQNFNPGGGQPTPGYEPGSIAAFQAQFPPR